MCHRSTKPAFLPNRCYAFVVFIGRGLFVHFGLSWRVGLVALLDFFVWICVSEKKYKCATKSVGYNSLNSSFVSLISCCLTVNKLFVKALATCHIKTGGTALPIALYCLFSETMSRLKLSGKD